MYCLRSMAWTAMLLNGSQWNEWCIQVVRIKKNLQAFSPQLPNAIPVKPSKSLLVLWGHSFVELKQAMYVFVVSQIFKRLIVLLSSCAGVTLRTIFGSTSCVHLIWISFSIWFSKFCIVILKLNLCSISQNIHINVLKSQCKEQHTEF